MELRKILLTIFCLYSLFFIIGSTLAPITAHYGFYDLSGKLTSLYLFSCHQQPNKSFWIMGYPIALCCRCYGFYWGVTISAILAIINKFNIPVIVLYIISIFVITDIFCNYVLKHSTGLYLRFIAGLLMGILFTVIINIKKEKKTC